MMRNCLVITCTTAMLTLTASVARATPPPASLTAQVRGGVAIELKFNDNDRRVTGAWYDSHQKHLPIGLRARDRFAPDVESRFQVGFVIGRTMRGQVHAVPPDLLRQLAPAPRGYRYVVIGGHIALIDSGYKVYDIIRVGDGG